MKSCYEYIKESLINEKFGSQILTGIIGSQKTYVWTHINSDLQWDKIPDGNVLEITKSQATQTVKNNDENDFIMYFNQNNELIGRSIGQRLYSINDKISTVAGLIRKYNVQKIVQILDWKQFETKELRKTRRELRFELEKIHDNWWVKLENEKRWKDLIRAAQGKKFLSTDVGSMISDMAQKLAMVLKGLETDENTLVDKSKTITAVYADFSSIMDDLGHWVYYYGKDEKNSEIAKSWANREATKSDISYGDVERFKDSIKKLKKYTNDIDALYLKYKDQLSEL